MTWDFAKSNSFCGCRRVLCEQASTKIAETIAGCEAGISGGQYEIVAAQQNSFPIRPIVISTDPPYYDNIGYADLSDFFYVWLRRSLAAIWPDLFRRLTTPKDEELVATPYRHGGKEEAEAFFMTGHGRGAHRDAQGGNDAEPLAIYYAFKQSEIAEDGITSAGWASFLQAVVDVGLAVDGTWPVRTE